MVAVRKGLGIGVGRGETFLPSGCEAAGKLLVGIHQGPRTIWQYHRTNESKVHAAETAVDTLEPQSEGGCASQITA